ncbi:MAG: UvrB/UvrC motif-containing protein [Clostridia bacterium]|nr:UvrB/UvrC motif-containing protein [Clostridia bacterium]
MKCQRCNEREANTHIQKIVNGKKTEYFLCDKCAAEAGEFKVVFDTDFDEFFGGFLGKPMGLTPKTSSAMCTGCGMTLSEFMKNGRLGCSRCYEDFKGALLKPLRQIHGEASHKGKIPKRSGEKISTQTKIKKLQAELDTAVLNQEFEKAAELRDKIKELSKGGEK